MLIPMSLGQQTGAVRTLFAKVLNGRGTSSRRRSPRPPKRRTAKATRRSAPKVKRMKRMKARLVKGSAAARAYMAKIRKMRR